MMRAVQFIVEDHGIFQRVIDVVLFKGFLVGTGPKEGIEFTFDFDDHDPSVSVEVVFDCYDLALALDQIFAVADVQDF